MGSVERDDRGRVVSGVLNPDGVNGVTRMRQILEAALGSGNRSQQAEVIADRVWKIADKDDVPGLRLALEAAGLIGRRVEVGLPGDFDSPDTLDSAMARIAAARGAKRDPGESPDPGANGNGSGRNGAGV